MGEIVRLKDFDAKTPILINTNTGTLEVSVADVIRWVAPTAPEPEAMKFLQTCRVLGVNPLLKEAHFVNKGGTWTVIVDKSAFIRKAEENPNFDRFEAGVIIQELIRDSPKASPSFGPEEIREGSFVPKTHVATGGWCRVYFKDGRVFKHTVSMDEYSSGVSTWKAMPATMIRKVAIVQALSESGACYRQSAYTPEEMGLVVDAVKVTATHPVEPIADEPSEVVDVEFVDGSTTHPLAQPVKEEEQSSQPADYDDGQPEPNYVALDHAGLVGDFLGLASTAGMTDEEMKSVLNRREVTMVEQLDRNQLVSLCRALRQRLDRPFPELIRTHEENVEIARDLAGQLFQKEDGSGAFDMEKFSNYFLGMFEDDYPAPTITGLNPQDLCDLICAMEEPIEAKKADPDTLIVPTFQRRVLATA